MLYAEGRREEVIPVLFKRVLRGGSIFFFFNDTATTEIYTLSLHDALPILGVCQTDEINSSRIIVLFSIIIVRLSSFQHQP